MSFKIPCGGFKLDEKLFFLDKNDVLSIPKPLTYDYMPEGYPSKSVGTVTLMEEQEVAFSEQNGLMVAVPPVDLEIKLGDKLTVVWDGVSYDTVVKKVTADGMDMKDTLGFGSLVQMDDYPFSYMASAELGFRKWGAAGTATSHTIGVMRQQVTYTPMDANFIPNTIQRVGDDVIISSSTADSTKKFKITVDDSGTIKATEVT